MTEQQYFYPCIVDSSVLIPDKLFVANIIDCVFCLTLDEMQSCDGKNITKFNIVLCVDFQFQFIGNQILQNFKHYKKKKITFSINVSRFCFATLRFKICISFHFNFA